MATTDVKVADGRVEETPGGTVTGWAWNPADDDDRVTVTVWVNGRPVASGVADQDAPGLEQAGIGDGRHAFAIPLPGALLEDAEEELRVAIRVDGASGTLPLLEDWARTGEGNPWSDVRLVEDEHPPLQDPIPDDVPPPVGDPATTALTGSDGWLFGLSPADADRLTGLRGVADELQRSATLLDQLGIRYVVAIVPPKLSVHPERATMPTAGVPRCAPELEALARDDDSLEIFDLLPVLLDARRHGPLYEPRDEQLSALGAFHVTRALVKRAGPVGGLRAMPSDAMRLATPVGPAAAGLEELPRIGAEVGSAGSQVPVADAAALHALRMPAGGHLESEGQPAPRVYERTDRPQLPRAAIVGDPVIHSVAPWLAEVTSRLVVLSSIRVPLAPVELEHPTVVFHLLDDRRLLA
jgi:hypothetical protein